MSYPRIPLIPGQVYHVYTHANGSENLFRSEENYRYFLEKYCIYVFPVVETYAYCLMPNHLHLMVKIRTEEELRMLSGFENLESCKFSKAVSLKFSHLFNGYTQSYNRQYDRKGSLFIDSFHRKHVDSDEYFTALVTYIHANPVRHGFVKDICDWPYSSWHAYMHDFQSMLNKDEVLRWFGDRSTFTKVHQDLELSIGALSFKCFEI